LRRVTAVVLAGGASRRFRPDKLAEQLDGEPLLDHVLASLPEQATTVIVVGAVREVTRPVIFASEEPPGGGPAAALVAGLRRALEESSDAIVTLPGDAPLAGQAAGTLLSRLGSEPNIEAVVAIDSAGHQQPLQLALRRAAAE
jgi:molybdopterin-guanine dinucleotide biosynthesis protein A